MATQIPTPPKVGMVSLGCPKALVDSERILTKLRSDGYGLSPDFDGADVVLVNTCGFLDSAKEESLEAIGEAIAENGRVIVTGCMGKEADLIRDRFPDVLAISGPQQYEEVVSAVHDAAPMPPSPYVNLVPETGLKLTPRHYSYVKISEGCNHRCAFCIIPSIRGDLVSRRPDAILREAEKLVAAGTKELLVISQDTSAYGLDLKHAAWPWKGEPVRAHMTDLAREFNESAPTLADGSTVGVDLRRIASGTGYQFIASGTYVPDGFSPSNELWASMASEFQPLTLVDEQTVPNVAGIVMKSDTLTEFRTTYGEVSAASLVDAVIAVQCRLQVGKSTEHRHTGDFVAWRLRDDA